MKIKKGDEVVVISGKYKGVKGKVLQARPEESRVVVEGVNRHKWHIKPTQEQPGHIVDREAPIHVSNVALIDPKTKKTGNAREGERYNVHMRGGGVVHGPVVRDHSIDLPKKIRSLGLKMALSSKLKEGSLVVIDSEKVKVAKTNALAKQLKKLNIVSALFVGAETVDENFKKSAANIINVDVLPTIGLNVLDILKHEKLVLTADAVKAVEARLS